MRNIKRLNSEGITHLLVPVIVICLIAAVGSYLVYRSSAEVDPKYDINKVSVQLGAEEHVAGPSNGFDTPYFTERNPSGKWYGFTGNSSSFVLPLNDNFLPVSPFPKNKKDVPANQVMFDRDTSVEFGSGSPAHPDACGAWILGSIYKEEGNKDHWYGWYHAENDCPRTAATGGERTHMSMAFTESLDNGKTWKKPNYPNNRIITADNALASDPARNDTGNGRVIKINNYYYIFYQSNSAQDAGTGRNIHVARSNVSDLGRPGTWKKWYCTNPGDRSTCDFNQPGVGGKSTKITNPDGKTVLKDQYITYNRYLNRYIAFNNDNGSFRLVASEGLDFLTWTSQSVVVKPIPTTTTDPTIDNWSRCSTLPAGTECKQLYGYNSITGMYGNSDGSGQNLYLYYMKQFPGQGFGDGYVMRTQVTLLAGPATPTLARTVLSVYQDANGNKRITSELPEPWLGFKLQSSIGYVLSNPATGYVPIFECKKPDGAYYTKRFSTDAQYGVPVPATIPTMCTSTDKLVRRVGWVSPVRTDVATEPIYDVITVTASTTGSSSPIGYALKGLR